MNDKIGYKHEMWVRFSLPPSLISLTRIGNSFQSTLSHKCFIVHLFLNEIQAIERLLNLKYVHGGCIEHFIQNALSAGYVVVMCGTVWMHLLLLRPPLWSPCPGRPAQRQRHDTPCSWRAQTQAELRLCHPVSCLSASVHVTHLRNIAEQTTFCGIWAIPSLGFFSSTVGLPPLCWRRLTRSGCLLLSASHFSAPPVFSALTCHSPLSLEWTGHVHSFLGLCSEEFKKNEDRSMSEEFKCWFVFWQFSSFASSLGNRPTISQRRWSTPLEWPDSLASFSLLLPLDILSVKQQSVLRGNIQLCFQ